MVETSLISAFLVGLLGGVHCVGMCGGIVGALTLGLPPHVRDDLKRTLPYLLAYNLGRIGSYTLAGVLFGGLGFLAANLGEVHQVQQGLHGLAGVFMIALGLYLGGWWLGLTRLEGWGSRVWRRIEPMGRGLLPVRTPLHALGLGAIWGWIPCGLVYSVLIWAISRADPIEGGLLLLAFGAGTLPNLLLMGTAAQRMARLTRRVWVRRAAGLLVIGFGMHTLLQLALSRGGPPAA